MKARLVSILPVVGAMAATALLFGAGAASAATTNVYCPSDDLQSAINGAGFGDTIVVYGTCFGNFTISSKTLTLQGGSAGAALNGRNSNTTLVIGQSTVSIRNLSIVNGNGVSGGGLEVLESDVTMTNATVKGNRASLGGGFYIDLSDVEMTGVTVTRNTALYQGGGISVFDSTLSLTASTVSNNTTTSLGLEYGGGGLRMNGSVVDLTSTKVTTNRSADYGGGIADYGGGIQRCSCVTPFQPPIEPGELSLVNSSVDHNIAAFEGGGIYNVSEDGDSPVTLQGTTVSFNVAQGTGGSDGDGGGIANYAVCNRTASILATGSTFQGNQARVGAGGAVFNGTGTDGCGQGGTALVTIAHSPTATGPNVVNSNQAAYGGGFANEQDFGGVASLSLQSGVTVRGNKASVTGGGVWSSCGSLSSLAQILLNSPNNVVNTC